MNNTVGRAAVMNHYAVLGQLLCVIDEIISTNRMGLNVVRIAQSTGSSSLHNNPDCHSFWFSLAGSQS